MTVIVTIDVPSRRRIVILFDKPSRRDKKRDIGRDDTTMGPSAWGRGTAERGATAAMSFERVSYKLDEPCGDRRFIRRFGGSSNRILHHAVRRMSVWTRGGYASTEKFAARAIELYAMEDGAPLGVWRD